MSALLLTLTVCLALLVVGWFNSPIEVREWQAIIGLLVLALAAELLPVQLGNTGIHVTATMPVICAAIVVHGALAGGLIDGFVTMFAGYMALGRRKDIHRWLWISFNTSQAMISAIGAGILISLIPYSRASYLSAGMLWASILSIGLYMAINSSAVAWMKSRIEGRSMFYWLSTQWRMVGPKYVIHGLIALIVIAPYNLTHGWSMVAVFVPVLAVRNYLRLRHRQMNTYRETVRALGLMIQHAHPYTSGHLYRVSVWGAKTASCLGLSEEDAELVSDAAMLHDIGKIAVSEEILDKPGKLNDDEWKVIHKHPETGAQILSEITLFESLSDWVGSHHERPDGKGYPNGLRDDQIPIQSKIIAVVDAFDAMVVDSEIGEKRPYRMPRTLPEAIQELRNNAGSQFDPKVVAAFTEVVEGMNV